MSNASTETAPDAESPCSFAAVEAALAKDRYLEGMYRRLQAAFPDLPHPAIEDALFEAAEKCAKRPTPPDNVRAWLYTVARRRLLDVVKRRPVDALDFADDTSHPAAAGPSVEDQAMADDTYNAVVGHVRTWPTTKVREVVLLVLAAAHDDEPITNRELAELATSVLGEEMTEGTAAVHKSRGLARLRQEYPLIVPTQHDTRGTDR